MKKRSTKNFLTRLTAFIVMALMLVPIIPLTANAESTGYQDGDLLLKMNALDGTATYNPYGVKLGTSTAKYAKLDEDDKTKILNTTAGSSSAGGVGITTDLPFNSSTAYTIEYYAKLTDYSNNRGAFFGFCQNTSEAYTGANMLTYATQNKVNTYSKWWVNGYYKKDGSDRYGKGIGCNPWTDRADDDGFVRFVLTFDGQYMSLSIGGIAVDVRYDLKNPGTGDFASISEWPNENLCLSGGFTIKDQGDYEALAQDYCVMQIKNISVYKGVVDPAPNVEDGGLLLEMSAFDDGKVTYNPYGITVADGSNAGACRDATDSTKIIAGTNTQTAGKNGGVALSTSLPLNNDVAYTIEYEAMLNDPSNGLCMFAGFYGKASWCVNGINIGVYANGQNVKTVDGYTIDIYNQVGADSTSGTTLPVNVWEKCADDDGFVKFVMTYDKGTLTLSVDGSNIGVCFDVTNATKDNCYDTADITNLNLAFGYAKADNEASVTPEQDAHILSVKDIAIYAGARTAVEVRDENGNVIDKVETFDGEGIAATELAEVEGEQVIWCDPYTGAVVDAPSGIYTRDTVLVAKSRDLDASDVIGVQFGEVGDDGKRNIRIVAGMYNTDGTSVGFDVLIAYKKDGVLTQEKYRVTSGVVYESINANVDGDITNHTAKALGANYLIALAVEGVDTKTYSQIDFKVASFRTFDGSDVRVHSEIFEFSIVGGEFTTTADRLA